MSFAIKLAQERRGAKHVVSFLHCAVLSVTAIPSFLPHLIWVIAFAMLLAAILQPANILSRVLVEVLLPPVLWESVLILVNSYVSKFIFHLRWLGTLRIQSHA